MKAKNTTILVLLSLIAGLVLSSASVIHIAQRTTTTFDDDPAFTTSVVRRGFPVAYISISEGTACNGGTESSLRGVFASGTCGRDLDRSGRMFALNTIIWSTLTFALLLVLKKRRASNG